MAADAGRVTPPLPPPAPAVQSPAEAPAPRPARASGDCAYLFWQHEDEAPHALVGSLVTLDTGMRTVRAADEAAFVSAVEQAMTGTGSTCGDYVLVRRPGPHAPAASCRPCRLDAG